LLIAEFLKALLIIIVVICVFVFIIEIVNLGLRMGWFGKPQEVVLKPVEVAKKTAMFIPWGLIYWKLKRKK
jgi:hypothetical protein